MSKFKFETADRAAENINKLTELFPEAVAEGRVNFDLLRAILGEENITDEAYEFTWAGKHAAIAEVACPLRKTLRPCEEESKNYDATENLYIEGDNLDVLKLLRESYLGKVKLIYIDPPYNTGGDLIYKNKFAAHKDEYDKLNEVTDEFGNFLFVNNENNGRFHSDWCAMMYARLNAARSMLTDDGFIALSIDHNELFNIGKICDEIFGAANRVAIVTVVHKPEGRNQEKFFGTSNEFLLVYAKDKSNAEMRDVVLNETVALTFDMNDEKGNYRKKNFIRLADGKYATREAKPNFWYPIYVSGDLNNFSLEKKENYHEVYPVIKSGVERTWKTLPKTFMELAEKNNIVAEKDEKGKIVIFEKLRENQVIKTHWIKKEYHAYHYGTKILDELLGAKTFDFPKSLYLITDILKLFTGGDDLVLDFFSGSATTAHAVMRLNAEDGGSRTFIMVQMPEACAEGTDAYAAGYKNICEIGKERIRRAGEKIVNEKGPTAPNFDVGFRVLKLSVTNMNDMYYAASEYTQDMIMGMEDNIKPDRTDMDLLYGCLLDYGMPLSLPHTREIIDGFTVHTYNGGDLAACFGKCISDAVIRVIANRKPLRAVFRDSGFANSPEKINVFEIFKLLAPGTHVRVI